MSPAWASISLASAGLGVGGGSASISSSSSSSSEDRFRAALAAPQYGETATAVTGAAEVAGATGRTAVPLVVFLSFGEEGVGAGVFFFGGGGASSSSSSDSDSE